MKEKMKDLGCLIWILLILFLSAGSGWLGYQALISIIKIPVWMTVVLSIFGGALVLLLLVIISFLVLVMTSKEYDGIYPDNLGTN